LLEDELLDVGGEFVLVFREFGGSFAMDLQRVLSGFVSRSL
jgi:hypothetical protein